MPVISRLFGIVIRMHLDDHPLPYFQASLQDLKAFIVIETGRSSGDGRRSRRPASWRVGDAGSTCYRWS